MPTINGSYVEQLNAIQAHTQGYLSYSEYLDTYLWEEGKLEKGHYVPNFIYVDGIYKGVTRQGEQLIAACIRLKILT